MPEIIVQCWSHSSFAAAQLPSEQVRPALCLRLCGRSQLVCQCHDRIMPPERSKLCLMSLHAPDTHWCLDSCCLAMARTMQCLGWEMRTVRCPPPAQLLAGRPTAGCLPDRALLAAPAAATAHPAAAGPALCASESLRCHMNAVKLSASNFLSRIKRPYHDALCSIVAYGGMATLG